MGSARSEGRALEKPVKARSRQARSTLASFVVLMAGYPGLVTDQAQLTDPTQQYEQPENTDEQHGCR